MFLHIQSLCEYKLHATSAVVAGLGKTWILAAQTLPKSGPEGRFWRDSGLDGLAGMVEVAMLAGLAGQLVLVAGTGGKMELCKGIKAVWAKIRSAGRAHLRALIYYIIRIILLILLIWCPSTRLEA